MLLLQDMASISAVLQATKSQTVRYMTIIRVVIRDLDMVSTS